VNPEPLDPEILNGFGKYIILELFVFPLFPTPHFELNLLNLQGKKPGIGFRTGRGL